MAAVISECGTYLYRLSRELDASRSHRVAFIGINPSTADATIDDVTVRKWAGFTSRWGNYAGFDVVNLFAFRSTSVIALASAADPIGPDNNDHIWAVLQEADTVVPCWGSRNKIPEELHPRIEAVKRMIAMSGSPVHILGLTKSGDPKHPLMLGYNTLLTEWPL